MKLWIVFKQPTNISLQQLIKGDLGFDQNLFKTF